MAQVFAVPAASIAHDELDPKRLKGHKVLAEAEAQHPKSKNMTLTFNDTKTNLRHSDN